MFSNRNVTPQNHVLFKLIVCVFNKSGEEKKEKGIPSRRLSHHSKKIMHHLRVCVNIRTTEALVGHQCCNIHFFIFYFLEWSHRSFSFWNEERTPSTR